MLLLLLLLLFCGSGSGSLKTNSLKQTTLWEDREIFSAFYHNALTQKSISSGNDLAKNRQVPESLTALAPTEIMIDTRAWLLQNFKTLESGECMASDILDDKIII